MSPQILHLAEPDQLSAPLASPQNRSSWSCSARRSQPFRAHSRTQPVLSRLKSKLACGLSLADAAKALLLLSVQSRAVRSPAGTAFCCHM